ncbi:unnamed protein product, partial [marine sediment metagenome]
MWAAPLSRNTESGHKGPDYTDLPIHKDTRMKVVATGNRKAWLVSRPKPEAEGNEVVVKLLAAPICGSNMHAFFGEGEHLNDGHEGAGEVVEVDRSSRLEVGDRVVVQPMTGCGECADCLRGDAIYCADRPEIHGMFAQFTRRPDFLCTPLPEEIDCLHGSLMGCALGPASDAIKQLGLKSQDMLVVTGLGPVGLGAVALAAWKGARVIGVDPVAWRRERALQLGAEAVFDSAEPDLLTILREKTAGTGPSLGIDASGNPEAERLLIDLAT